MVIPTILPPNWTVYLLTFTWTPGLLSGTNLHWLSSLKSSQIDTALALSLNLKSHLTLIGHSDIGNGQKRYDYLSFANVSILGVTAEILVKVAPGQPCLLGLDAMVMFDMALHLAKAKFDITAHPTTDTQLGYRFLHTPDYPIYRRVVPALDQRQLVSFDQLPPPGPIDTLPSGQTQQVLGMDLGVSYSVRRGSPMFDCGFS